MNKIILDGKEYKLSDDLAEKIKAEVMEQEIPFERKQGDRYYYITSCWSVCEDVDKLTITDDGRYEAANYCRDKELMDQRALHEILNRQLWRYSETHGGDEIWDIGRKHYYIRRWRNNGFEVSFCEDGKMDGVTYFRTRDVAEVAIEKVVKPFMAEHPEFVW